MTHRIEVVDLFSGIIGELSSETPTLDVPRGFDAGGAGLLVDAEHQARFTTRRGRKRVYRAVAVKLSTRSKGEACMVSAARADTRGNRTFRLSIVDHA